MLGQKRNIVAPFPQRRQMHLHHVQSVEQVLSEFPLLHHLRQFPICRADQPNIHADFRVAAQPLKTSLLQHSQQLRL